MIGLANKHFGTIVARVATGNWVVSIVKVHTYYSKLAINKLVVQKCWAKESGVGHSRVLVEFATSM